MKKNTPFLIALTLIAAVPAITNAQINASLFRYPDVSATQIVFTYANDLWVVPKDGGKATHLSSPAGVEGWPKFSPDGNTIAFNANYDGNTSIYTIPTTGGIPNRLTWYGGGDRLTDWYPDGKHILFASLRQSGRERFNRFFSIPGTGGTPEALPLPYAEFGSLSPDGSQVAFTYTSQIGRNWKRYRGGWAGKIHLHNLNGHADENISAGTDADEELPMWHDKTIYFLSDRGEEKRMNLWEYDITTKKFTQLTHFADYDVHYPSLGPADIVFEEGGALYLYTIATKQYKQIPVQVVTDENALRPTLQPTEKLLSNIFIAPDGKKVVVEARGDLYTVPAENGPVKNITQTSGVAERYPAWSPDGRYIAYWSDRSGEYELMLKEAGKPEKKLTSYGPGFRYNIYWSPDSKKIAFIDKAMKIHIYDRTTDQTTYVDQGQRMTEGPLQSFYPNWSPDSRWLTYSRDIANGHQAVYIYDVTGKQLHQVTSPFYSSSSPVFDPTGKYLYITSNQQFKPLYSDMDNTFIYPNSTKLAAIVLKKSTPSPLYPKSDTVAIKTEPEPASKKPPTPQTPTKSEPPSTTIEFDGLETRIILLPIDAGNFGSLQATDGKLIYLQQPNTGSESKTNSLKYFDLDKRKTKTIIDDINGFQLAADNKHILINKSGGWYIIGADEGQKAETKLRTAEMQQWVNPREEWRQIFVDAWRLERDYFYDSTMHGVNWNKVRTQYAKLIEEASTREEVDFILGEMIGELNASHTYHGGGAVENTKQASVGYLGIDWAADGEYYKIKKIIRGAAWDAEVRSPLDQPGVAIKEGDYILAVNGVPLTTKTDPYAVFGNLAGKTIELTYNTAASLNNTQTAIVQTLTSEYRLRNLAWIEEKRHAVEEATDGQVGYVYVRSTGIDGQDELIRQFTGQLEKKALIIDERWNDGGQIPDRFIEMLNRKPLAWWATRDGVAWQWPPAGNFGPKVMLINGWSGSGGDAFPDYFRKAGIGPLIGTRTWGGLIGISGAPGLIDGGGITVPTFRMYNPDGTWFKEGHGVDPDIIVPEDLNLTKDNQLERAISEIKELLKKAPTAPNRPAAEPR